MSQKTLNKMLLILCYKEDQNLSISTFLYEISCLEPLCFCQRPQIPSIHLSTHLPLIHVSVECNCSGPDNALLSEQGHPHP